MSTCINCAMKSGRCLKGNTDQKNVIEWQKLTITLRDNRIAQLESTIREVLIKYKSDDLGNLCGAIENLRELVSNPE